MNPRPSGAASLSAGYLATLPLFLAYEGGLLALGPLAQRAAAERVVGRILFLFGEHLAVARLTLLFALAAVAYHRTRREFGDARSLFAELRSRVLEGMVAGVLLAPFLIALQAWSGAPPVELPPVAARPLASSLRLLGAAPWEELLFRVGALGALTFAAARVLSFLGLERRAAGLGGEALAWGGSAGVFAWFHLDSAQRLLGDQGEPFHAGPFLWRFFAGLVLAALFRWRGLGVAAWSHAVFNLGLSLGIRA